MKKLLSSGLAIGAMISLVGCGGGSSSSGTPATVSGQFIDAAVQGLNYTCMSSGLNGATDNTGAFTCQATDDNVTFSIGAYVIGSSTSTSGVVTPYNITADETAAIDVAQLLQTLDSGEDGVITIPADFTALDDVNATPGSTEFESQVEAALETTLVGEGQAKNNMDADILKTLFSGKTYYVIVDNNPTSSIERMVVDENVTVADITDVTPDIIEGDTYTDDLEIINNRLVINGNTHMELNEQFDDYLLFDYYTTGDTPVAQVRLYSDQAKAEAYYDSLRIPMTTEMLSGKVFYTEDDSSVSFEYISFISSTKVIFREILTDGNGNIDYDSGANEYPYTINASGEVVISLDELSANTYTLLSTTDTQWNIVKESDGSEPYYDTWLLNAPSGFPVIETTPEPTPDPTTTPTTFVSGKSFDIGDGMILTFGSDYSFSDTDGCSGTWSEVTSNSLAVTGGCGFDVTFNGELVDGVAVTINVTDESPAFTFNTTFTEVASSTTPPSTAPTLADLLAGKTVYGENNYDAWTFNETLTQVSIIDVDALPGSVPEVIDISVEGNIITADGGATTIEALYRETDIKLTWLTGIDAGMVDNIWFDLATLESILGM